MAITVAAATANAILDVVDDRINAGSAAGNLQVATSTAFTTALANVTLNDPSHGTASNKSMALSVSPALSATILASGDAAAWRFRDSDNTEVLRGTAGESGSGADMIIDEATLVSGGTFSVTSGSLSVA
jgi:hypothetical protein